MALSMYPTCSSSLATGERASNQNSAGIWISAVYINKRSDWGSPPLSTYSFHLLYYIQSQSSLTSLDSVESMHATVL
jgi:hypothetical protein